MSRAALPHVLIATVGQTPEPVLTTLAHHAPDGAVFIASQATQRSIAQVLDAFEGGLRTHTLLLDDAESLTESYDTALKALDLALTWEAHAITADLTGGTKPMVAGLTLALTGRGVVFSYVGGSDRDETGRVRSGRESVLVLEDPSAHYNLQEWATFQRSWNAWRFPEARDSLEAILARPQTPSASRFYRHLLGVTQGLVDWDHFRHAPAQEALESHLEPALAIAEAWRHGAKVRVLAGVEDQLPRLRTITAAPRVPHRSLLEDLLANAERRAEAGRYDDALARLYRTVEMAAEVDVQERHGVNLKDPASWPQRVRAHLGPARAQGVKDVLEQAARLDVLERQTGTLAQRLDADYRTRLRPLLQRRHESILAHGFQPVSREDYQALGDALAVHALSPAPPFPRW